MMQRRITITKEINKCLKHLFINSSILWNNTYFVKSKKKTYIELFGNTLVYQSGYQTQTETNVKKNKD